jgi:hypothetical protein
VVKTLEKKGVNVGFFGVKYKTDRNLWLHQLAADQYGVGKLWVLLYVAGWQMISCNTAK